MNGAASEAVPRAEGRIRRDAGAAVAEEQPDAVIDFRRDWIGVVVHAHGHALRLHLGDLLGMLRAQGRFVLDQVLMPRGFDDEFHAYARTFWSRTPWSGSSKMKTSVVSPGQRKYAVLSRPSIPSSCCRP